MPQATAHTIASDVEYIFDLFSQVDHIFDEPSRSFKYLNQRQQLQEELGRFRVWAGNIGAHKTGRSSLQYRLRDAFHLEKRLRILTFDLKGTLQEVISIVSGSKQSWDSFESDQLSDSDDDTNSESSSPIGVSPNTEPMADSEFQQLILDIGEIVTCLFRFSMTVRQPVSHTKFARAAEVDKSAFEPFDINHVREKFPTADDRLVERLGKAITSRRRYLTYRENHQRKLEHGLVERMRGLEVNNEDEQTQYNPLSTVASSLPQGLINPSYIDAEFETGSEAGNSETSFASSTDEGIRLYPPPLPTEALSEHPYQCPICYMIIDIRTTIAWRRHVFKDLHPYICTFDKCTTPDRLFERRSEWFHHERQLHRRTWQCLQGCLPEFNSIAAFEEHLRVVHPTTFIEDQLPALVEMSETKTAMDKPGTCPLCKESLPSLKQLRRHIGRHQEQLALFALPSSIKEGDEPEDKALDSDGKTDSDTHKAKDHSDAGSELSSTENEGKNEGFEESSQTENPFDVHYNLKESDRLSLIQDVQAQDANVKLGDEQVQPPSPKPNKGIEGETGRDAVNEVKEGAPWRKAKSEDLPTWNIYPEPNCAICNGPSDPECPCESERLQIGVAKAERRFLGKSREKGLLNPSEEQLAELRDYVIRNAREVVVSEYKCKKQQRIATYEKYITSLPNLAAHREEIQSGSWQYGSVGEYSTPEVSELAAQVHEAYAELCQGIHEGWRQDVQRYPKELDRFYDTVSVYGEEIRVPPPEVWRIKGQKPEYRAIGFDDDSYTEPEPPVHSQEDNILVESNVDVNNPFDPLYQFQASDWKEIQGAPRVGPLVEERDTAAIGWDAAQRPGHTNNRNHDVNQTSDQRGLSKSFSDQLNVAPNCAICNGPAYPECSCESERLQIAVAQAQMRFLAKMKSTGIGGINPQKRTDLWKYVLSKSRINILDGFERRRETRGAAYFTHIFDLPDYTYYEREFHEKGGDITRLSPKSAKVASQIQAAYNEFQRGITSDWRSEVQRYPQVLDQYYDQASVVDGEVQIPGNESSGTAVGTRQAERREEYSGDRRALNTPADKGPSNTQSEESVNEDELD